MSLRFVSEVGLHTNLKLLQNLDRETSMKEDVGLESVGE